MDTIERIAREVVAEHGAVVTGPFSEKLVLLVIENLRAMVARAETNPKMEAAIKGATSDRDPNVEVRVVLPEPLDPNDENAVRKAAIQLLTVRG